MILQGKIKLIKRLIDNVNFSSFFITADHGFIYKYDKLEEHDIDINTLARMTRISKSSLHRKMRGEQEFSLRDIGRLTYTLDLEPEEVFHIFLAGYLPKKCRKAA